MLRLYFNAYLIFLLCTFNLTACSTNTMKITDYFDDKKVQQLASASAKGQVDVVNDLIKNQDVDPNAQGKEGMTPLWWAYLEKNGPGMKALMENGAQADMTSDGITMLDMSVGSEGEPYHELSKILLEGGANPNRAKSDTKKTPIFSAIYGGQLNNAQLLHQFGADINARDKCDQIPLMLALYTRSFDIAFWLVEQGAKVDAMNKNGGTPAWEIHDSLTNNLYSDSAKEAGLKMKAMMEKKGVKFPPLSPEENRAKFGITEECYN